MGTVWYFGILFVFVGDCFSNDYCVEKRFQRYRVVPDLISIAPKLSAEVCYPTGVCATQGNELCPSQLNEAPNVTWLADPRYYYTLIMADADVPCREAPVLRALLHWLVINIPGADLQAGETVFEYLLPTPIPFSGLHRYVFLVYQQPSRICYNGPSGFESRVLFSPDKFSAQYGLGCAYAGNFYLAQNAFI